jgi:hypothetical protein
MRREEADHILDDVAVAVLEAYTSGDRQVGPDILGRLLTEIGYMATGDCRCYPGGMSPGSYEGPQRGCPLHGEPAYWAAELLRDVQLRAVGGIPFGEPANVDPPEDHR